MQNSKKNRKGPRNGSYVYRRLLRLITILLVLLCIPAIWMLYRTGIQRPDSATTMEQEIARTTWKSRNQHTGTPNLTELQELLFWTPQPAADAITRQIYARSAILIDASSGTILLERNADAAIPPASMTKLAAIYTALRAVEAAEITLDDFVQLPPESWARNIPPGSSLMFLDQGQRVTVRELLTGMSIVSGNDAAIALAHHVSGSVPAFILRMNKEMERLGFSKTRFVEPTGLSDYNSTTAREFADFSMIYIGEYPATLKAFHSQREFAYPMGWNLPTGSFSQPVRQQNTNKLLDVLEGCDGLKTGFIYQSGYNLVLTAERDGTRFISVTMGGPGTGTAQGNEYRIKDGTLLMEWGFRNWRTERMKAPEPVSLTVWGGTPGIVRLIPAKDAVFTVPAPMLEISGPYIIKSKSLTGSLQAGTVAGWAEYRSGDQVVYRLPLITEQTVYSSAGILKYLDAAASLFARALNQITNRNNPVSAFNQGIN